MKAQGVSRRRGSCRPPFHATRTASFRAAVSAVTFGAAAILSATHSGAAPAGTARGCETPSSWVDIKTGRALDRSELFRDLAAKKSVVLLGESHTDRDHHSWQLQTLAAIGRGENLVIGFEAFPRRLQGVLDDWIAGKLSDDAFLKASEWRTVWGYDASLYMPLFQFARINRIPMVALNVDRSLVARVGQEGWEAVPKAEREGLSDPAPAGPKYQRELAHVYALKKLLPPGTDPLSISQGEHLPEPDEAALAEAMKEPQFKRFVEAQLTWDRGMAEALAGAKRKFPDAIVAGIVGSGHVEEGYGIPHQLEDLGVGYTSLIPVSTDGACKLVGTSFADAVFTLPPVQKTPPPERPRLGVLLGQGDGAPRVKQVVAGSVAEATGLRADDDIVRAAGLEMRKPDDLVEVVGRQAPGTWLPLSIRRDGQESDLIAKFPPRPRQE
jgi:uncharacterized iron-regulated protein